VENKLAHIFLVEDDQSLASLVCDYLLLQSFKVSIEGRGDNAVELILKAAPDLIILDLMLPGKNGLDICRELRPQTNVPIIMLTARSDEIDQIVGLEIGADDYIAKPVQPRLLLARINALLRRSKNSNDVQEKTRSDVIRFGQLEINKAKQDVYLDGQTVELTTNEFTLLTLFAVNAGQVLSRDDLLNNLRGIGYDGMDRTIDMLVSRLRKKLGDDPAKPYKIKTIWKKGYLFVADAW
jgi:two-component system OmpR family response regulator